MRERGPLPIVYRPQARASWAPMVLFLVWLLGGLLPGPSWFHVSRHVGLSAGGAVCAWIANRRDRQQRDIL